SSWNQPTYTGWTARDCLGLVGTQPAVPADNCDPHSGPIGTLPRYVENGLVSDGDPAVGFGPQRGANGKFDWTNGWRLYYANLTSNFSGQRSEQAFKGFEAIGVSRLDSQNYAQAKAGVNSLGGRQDCAVNTDSTGTLYVFWEGVDSNTRTDAIFMTRSFDGGKTFVRPAQVVTHFVTTGLRDPESGDLTFDGVTGARDGS